MQTEQTDRFFHSPAHSGTEPNAGPMLPVRPLPTRSHPNQLHLSRRVWLILLFAALSCGLFETRSARADSVDDEVARIQGDIRANGYSWTAGRTGFMELSLAERRARLGLRLPPGATGVLTPEQRDARPAAGLFPSSFSWLDQGIQIPIRDQGACGSCWAFSAMGCFECRIKLVTGMVQDLSEQQIISCSGQGCAGGWPSTAFYLMQTFGSVSEACMPYSANDQIPCTQDQCEVEDKILSWYDVGGDVASIKSALAAGPVSTTFTVYDDFGGYAGGCYEHAGQDPVNHAVVIMGWDDDACGGLGAWLCRNSWGPGFGLDGYFWIKYGTCNIGYGTMQINYSPLYPVVFQHTPLLDTDDTQNDYLVRADIISYLAPVASAKIYYRLGAGAYSQLPMTHVAGDTWEGQIPHQPVGTTIDYALNGTDEQGRQGYDPRGGHGLHHTFRVVYFVARDACESQGAWLTQAAGDNAVTGRWELGDPEGTNCGGAPVQSEDDSSPDPGSRCFVTGAPSNGCYWCNDVTGGVTTLLSPLYNLSGLPDATLAFDLWFVNAVGSTPADDPFQVDISSNGGTSWISLTTIPTAGLPGHWSRLGFDLSNFISLTPQVRVRFRASDTGFGSIVEAAIDELAITSMAVPADVPALQNGPNDAAGHLVLSRPVPNPTASTSRIEYVLPSAGPVDLGLYTIDGRRERTLVHGPQASGRHTFVLGNSASDGAVLPTGVYWLRLVTAGGEKGERLVVVR